MTAKSPTTRSEQIRARCNEFHKRNPEVWKRFQEIALELIRRGQKRYGAQTIFAIIRWESWLGDGGVTAFKINNDYAPLYSRRFQRTYPEHGNFFSTRRQTSKDAPASNLPALTPDDFE